MNRRQFSGGLLASILIPPFTISGLAINELAQAGTPVIPNNTSGIVSGKAMPPKTTLLSSVRTGTNTHALAQFDIAKQALSTVPLPSRAHEVITNPVTQEIVIFARRPGTWFMVLDQAKADLESERESKVSKFFESELQHHFYGHGLFTPEGRYLITTEQHIPSGEGRIVIRDREKNYQVDAVFPSYGIGPHQLALLSDQDTIVIANGGIQTHPNSGRKKMNLATMRPSLAYISRASGKLLEQHFLPQGLHQLSIRHIDVSEQDQVIIGMQNQGDPRVLVPLVGSHRFGQSIELFNAEESSLQAMKQYCGSVCFDTSGQYVAITSPKGNLVTLWDAQSRQLMHQFRCPDACGIHRLDKANFMLSSGRGDLYQLNIKEHSLSKFWNAKSDVARGVFPRDDFARDDLTWDNHLHIM